MSRQNGSLPLSTGAGLDVTRMQNMGSGHSDVFDKVGAPGLAGRAVDPLRPGARGVNDALFSWLLATLTAIEAARRGDSQGRMSRPRTAPPWSQSNARLA